MIQRRVLWLKAEDLRVGDKLWSGGAITAVAIQRKGGIHLFSRVVARSQSGWKFFEPDQWTKIEQEFTE